MPTELEAFGSADFEWVRQLKSVWADTEYHVDEIHRHTFDTIMAAFQDRPRKLKDSALGQVIVGAAGSGKTHLIGSLRHEVWERGGWFVLLDFAGIRDFWTSTALCFVDSLKRTMRDGRTQYQAILSRIVSTEGFDPRIRSCLERLISDQDTAVQIQRQTVRGFIQAFLVEVDRVHRGDLRYPDIVRACLLLILGDWDARNIAYSWLQGLEIDPEDLRGIGFGLARPAPIDLVRGMSWLMSLAGPTLIAIDQIDAIISEANLRRSEGHDITSAEPAALSIIESLAGGLMELHDIKYRAMTVVSCLRETWEILHNRSTVAMSARFSSPVALLALKNETAARRMIEARLALAYTEVHFEPSYPSWPFAPRAFATAVTFRPRQLLRACDDHRRHCLIRGRVVELESFDEGGARVDDVAGRENFDAMLEVERSTVDIAPLYQIDAEDRLLGEMLTKALVLFVAQTKLPDHVDLTIDSDVSRRPLLHARLTFTYHDEGDRERHYCFRALSHSNPIAFQNRLKAAMTASGIDRKLAFRHLLVLRHGVPPSGSKTATLVEAFKSAGGVFVAPSEDDLRTIVALHNLREAKHDGFLAWLQARKPLCDTALFHAAGLCGETDLRTAEGEAKASRASADPIVPEASSDSGFAPEAIPSTSPTQKPPTIEQQPPAIHLIPVGRRIEGGGLGGVESIVASQLPRHTAILGGAGSGKTVLLRRIIEEAALLKIPAIVLDTNNDLARLGDTWPERPEAFTDEDQAKAASYKADVEVVVWTPAISGGRPLRLAVLPDFSALSEDVDECQQAVDLAHATLLPFIGANARNDKGNLRSAILASSLSDFAQRGGQNLDAFVGYLSDLPDGVSLIKGSRKLASDIVDQLLASIALNPLLTAQGTPLDPRELFGEESGGKTRISVVNFSGLPADTSKQSFVNQLQMALFTFIKKHPSERGRIYAMDEAQNFAPAQISTPCKQSTLSLVAQARKYGLGMIFATQTPKGIDNKIISNCTTHFYGKMNAPATIEATQELVAAKGGHADDIAKLPTGVFYFCTEGHPKPVKIRTPLCLSYHPQNPLAPDEVVARARSGAA